MNNLTELIEVAALDRPNASFGTFSQNDSLHRFVERARTVAAQLRDAGFRRGDLVAFVGPNSAGYLVTWMAAQFVGLQTALINPSYPDELLGAMLDNLGARAIFWLGRSPGGLVDRTEAQLDLTGAWQGEVSVQRPLLSRGVLVSDSDGRCADPADVAAYIHTSGTTGLPKFCALSHGYFIRLGRCIADSHGLSHYDRVLSPLPMFHINPMGYGVVGSLTARASLLSMDRFQAQDFWSLAKAHHITAMILHQPPANLLMAKTTRAEAQGHQIRIAFGCVPDFLEKFDIPIGVTGYGSTEAGGLCHTRIVRPDDAEFPPEGPSSMAGRPRSDVEYRIADDGEIWVRGLHHQTLFSGYLRDGEILAQTDPEGWFRTGDRGRQDSCGNLIFIERMSDSIRVNGEYVPIGFVEERLKRVTSLGEFALWRTDSPARGHEVVLYTTAHHVIESEVHAALFDLPKYMHPTQLIRIEKLPLDTGVGKVQRRLLNDQPRISEVEL
ncbi:class I adenylate-forming enzyme family protein [Cupriavidus basilensis]|uniref:class I adenylate-forming enzyme family protein n=1 Tax=Cupriavidus basilensis TaxID=68895 RepID=UPI0023E829C1|nr:class I adenylate-forming enzyme family protein [Cupriavidus basilensis]MDF3885705.1 class I adenylate-forming enzyme family protein [Cupriavidus basilensis]